MKRTTKCTTYLYSAILVFAVLPGLSMAESAAATQIDAQSDGISIDFNGYSDQELLSMTVRISGPNGKVLEERTESGQLLWIPEDDLPDGNYVWEATVVTISGHARVREIAEQSNLHAAYDDGYGSAGSLESMHQEVPIERFFFDEDKIVTQQFGTFEVLNGIVDDFTTRSQSTMGKSTSSVEKSPNLLLRLVGYTLDLLVPSAHAQDLTATGTAPEVQWDRNGTTPTIDFLIKSWSGDAEFRGQNFDIFNIFYDAPNQSMSIRPDGSRPAIGIGTINPSETLHINSTQPRIRINNSAQAQSWYVKNTNTGRFEISENSGNDNAFTIEPGTQPNALHLNGITVGMGTDSPQDLLHINSPGNAARIRLQNTVNTYQLATGETSGFRITENGTTQFQIMPGAPTNSMRITSDGNVGLGTNSPQHTVHAVSNGGLAQIRVTETNGSNGLTMFAIENSGHPRFRLRNSSLNSNWDFRTAGSGSSEQFQITNISDGQSNFPFRLFKNGDLEVEGDVTANGVLLTSTREAKTDFAPLDVNDVLDRLATLEISQWRYKHEDESTVHFGPVAEEFHEIFGLSDGKHLNMIDTNGITFAAIQALNQKNRELRTENRELMTRLERLESALNL